MNLSAFKRRLVYAVTMMGMLVLPVMAHAGSINLFFPGSFKEEPAKAKGIAEALSKASGLEIQPRIAPSNKDLMVEFTKGEPIIAYIGSFISAIMQARGALHVVGQVVTGKEAYASILVAPASAGSDAGAILKAAGSAVAYAEGASSGESGAKAATDGAAAMATKGHEASVLAVKNGKAQAAFVKNHWWEANKGKYPDMNGMSVPGVSTLANPDNLLVANKSVSAEVIAKLKDAAKANAAAFGGTSFVDAGQDILKGSLELMSKGKIDPLKYEF